MPAGQNTTAAARPQRHRGGSEGDVLISVPGFTVRILGEGQALGGTAKYEVQTSKGEDGLLHVAVLTKAKGLRASLLELGYDPAQYIPETGAHGDWPKVKQEPLHLAILDEPGTVYYGAVLPNPAKQKGASGRFELLNVGFRPIRAGEGFIPSGAPGGQLPRLDSLGQLDGDFNRDGSVGLGDLLALAKQPGEQSLGGLRQIQSNFMLALAPDASDMARAGDTTLRIDGHTAPPQSLNQPHVPQQQPTAIRPPQGGGIPGIGGQLSLNAWPGDKRAQKWLTGSFLNLPALNSDFGVYQDAQAQQYAERVFELTNYYRVNKTKLGELRRDPHLDAIAQAQAMHLARNNYFEHDTPDGLTPFDRLDSTDPPRWWTAGENIAGGQPTPDNVVKTWMNSKGHKKNIRNRDYHYIGIGAYYDPHSEYGWYWVQVFASFEQDPSQHDWIEPGERFN